MQTHPPNPLPRAACSASAALALEKCLPRPLSPLFPPILTAGPTGRFFRWETPDQTQSELHQHC